MLDEYLNQDKIMRLAGIEECNLYLSLHNLKQLINKLQKKSHDMMNEVNKSRKYARDIIDKRDTLMKEYLSIKSKYEYLNEEYLKIQLDVINKEIAHAIAIRDEYEKQDRDIMFKIYQSIELESLYEKKINAAMQIRVIGSRPLSTMFDIELIKKFENIAKEYGWM